MEGFLELLRHRRIHLIEDALQVRPCLLQVRGLLLQKSVAGRHVLVFLQGVRIDRT